VPDRIEERARFDLVRYANVWEDAEVLCPALAPAPGRRMLSIASAGDNAFALLAAGAEVVAADLSPAQLALVELKRAAIRRLGYEEALAFLGIQRGAEDRRSVYERLERDLPASARSSSASGWTRSPAASSTTASSRGTSGSSANVSSP
jgi:S-adenosylmethionine-diacylglycerol 3-amino-3-carboxypropyl transferase